MESKEPTRSQRFVAAMLEQCARDKGFAARLRRADNPDTEPYAYGILCAFGVNLERNEERRPFALIGAALSRDKRGRDGDLGLGEALRHCVEDEEQGAARLRRLLVCRRQEEVCRLLRPLLAYMAAKEAPLCHARLLDELLDFPSEKARRRIRLRWAQGYYGHDVEDETAEKGEACAS